MSRLVLAGLLLVSSAVLGTAQGFDDVFGGEPTEDMALSVEIHGDVGMEFRYFLDQELDSEVEAVPSADLEVVARGASAEAVLSLSVETSLAADGALVGGVIDELYVTSFFGAGRLTAGLIKVEWGTGDGVHAIDPLNATDQSSGPTTDYLESRIPVAMLDLHLYLGSSWTAEFVYKPFFRPTRAALAGRWAVVDMTSMPGYSAIEPVNVRTLEHSQGAVRVNGSLGPVDLGGMYYLGFMPEPGYRIVSAFTGTDPLDPTHYTISTELVYTNAHLFGAEVAAALGPFTIRGEGGYWLSEDSDGTAPELYNSRVVYLGGVDVPVPGTNLFTSVQVLGSYTMGTDGLAPEDVDLLRLSDGVSFSHLVVGAIEAPFARDAMKLRIAGAYAIEGNGYLVTPEYSWTIADGAEVKISGAIVGGSAPESGYSPYYAWRDNDYITVAFRYQF